MTWQLPQKEYDLMYYHKWPICVIPCICDHVQVDNRNYYQVMDMLTHGAVMVMTRLKNVAAHT